MQVPGLPFLLTAAATSPDATGALPPAVLAGFLGIDAALPTETLDFEALLEGAVAGLMAMQPAVTPAPPPFRAGDPPSAVGVLSPLANNNLPADKLDLTTQPWRPAVEIVPEIVRSAVSGENIEAATLPNSAPALPELLQAMQAPAETPPMTGSQPLLSQPGFTDKRHLNSAVTPNASREPANLPPRPPASTHETAPEFTAVSLAPDNATTLRDPSDVWSFETAFEDRPEQSAAPAERVQQALPVESKADREPVQPNAAEPVEGGRPITDQIKDAVHAHLTELRQTGRTEIVLHLDPPELGRIRIHLSASEGAVAGRMVVQDETVRAIVESQFGELRQRLTDAGVNLGRFDLAGGRDESAPQWHQAPARLTSPWLERLPGLAQPGSVATLRRGLIDLLA